MSSLIVFKCAACQSPGNTCTWHIDLGFLESLQHLFKSSTGEWKDVALEKNSLSA